MNSFCRRFLPVLLLGTVAAAALAQTSAQSKPAADFGKLPLSFEPNVGQTSSAVQWISRGPGFTLFLTGPDAVLELNKISSAGQSPLHKPVAPRVQSSALRFSLANAKAPSHTQGEEPQTARANYFTGSDPSQWKHDVPMYGRVRLNGVYPGVDLTYYGHGGQLEYDFVVAPNADASVIAFNVDGAAATLNPQGDLVLPVTGTTDAVTFNKPVVYQVKEGVRQAIEAAFKISAANQVSFALGDYDHTRELVIDPQLLFLGAYGTGNQQTAANGMTVDANGEIMITGITNDLALPVTAGAFQSSCGSLPGPSPRCGASSPGSAFVAKISADGTSLIYSTYLHGNGGYEYGGAIATDAAGDAYVLGATGSNDFPITSDAIQSLCLPYYPTLGFNNPPTYGPITASCDGYFAGGGTEYTTNDGSLFLVKLNPSGSNILYGTFFGGTQENDPIAIGLDSSGAIYFTTHTHGPSRALDYYPNTGNIAYPVTASAFEQYAPVGGYGGYDGAALTKLSADGHTLLYSTLLTAQSPTNPTSSIPTSLAVGQNGIAVVGGGTLSSSFPTTSGAFLTTCPLGGGTNPNCQIGYGFVSAFDTTKSGAASLVWSTYIGGNDAPGSNVGQDQVLSVAVDSTNNVYTSGYTGDANYPTTPGAYQTTCLQRGGFCSATFLTKLAAANGANVWSTYFGSTDTEYGVGFNGTGIVVDAKGRVNLYGSTSIGSYGTGGTMPLVNPIESPNNNGTSLFFTTFTGDGTKLLFSTQIHNTNLSVEIPLNSLQQGLAIDSTGNVYFGAYGADNGLLPTTTGTYDTPSTMGFNRTFFGKISPILNPTATTLSASPNTTVSGQPITFTATVAGSVITTPTPTGTVTLTNSSAMPATTLGTITLGSNGSGTFSTSALAVGSYNITATYSADANYDISASAAATVTINTPAVPTIALAVPSTGVVGAPVTLTATLSGSGGTPTGTVYFKDGSNTIGSAVLSSGVAAYSTSSLAAGTHSVSVSYSGDGVYSALNSAAQTLTITLVTPSLALTVPATATINSSVTMSVAVTGSGGTPTGSVIFKDGATTLTTVTLSGGGSASYSTSTLAAGAHTITAVYSGDSRFATATSVAQTLTINLVTPMVALTAPASALIGASVTLSSTVTGTGGTPTGTITFKDGTTTLSTVALASGSASYTTSSLAVGTHTITAAYSGDGTFAATVSATSTVTITPPAGITFAALPATITITHGSSGTVSIAGTPVGGFAGTVNFSCGTLPSSASCAFAPASLTFTSTSSAAQTSTLTINTSAAVASLRPLPAPGRHSNYLPGIVAAILLAPLGLFRRTRRARTALMRGSRKGGLLMMMLALLVGLGAITGCGSSAPAAATTPTGSYALTVSVSGANTATVAVQLIVQ